MKLSNLLLAEDDLEAAEILKALLEREGHVVVHKTLGSEVLEAVKHEGFDGILLDYMLPDMDGMELCAILRQSMKATPIILTTSHINKITPEMALAGGFTAFIPKPWSANAVKVIKQYVKTQSLFSPAALKAASKQLLWGDRK